MYTPADLQYINTQFVPLEDLCVWRAVNVETVRRRIGARELPAPPYPGLELFPGDYFDLPDDIAFRRLYVGPDPAEVEAAYLDGIYFVCLIHATPRNIMRKSNLVDELHALLAAPQPENESWLRTTRRRIDELDLLERPFSPDYDRARFGRRVTRDELIDEPRRKWLALTLPQELEPRTAHPISV
jgi:hypothetical protein